MRTAPDPTLRQHLDSLGLHLEQCRPLSRWAYRSWCALEALDAAVAPRLFTSVACAGLLIGLTLLIAV